MLFLKKPDHISSGFLLFGAAILAFNIFSSPKLAAYNGDGRFGYGYSPHPGYGYYPRRGYGVGYGYFRYPQWGYGGGYGYSYHQPRSNYGYGYSPWSHPGYGYGYGYRASPYRARPVAAPEAESPSGH